MVISTEAIFTPLDVVREFGFTVHFVRLAGTVHDRSTIEEKPKNGETAMRFRIYKSAQGSGVPYLTLSY